MQFITPQPGVRMGGWWEKVCPCCISETIRCKNVTLGRDIVEGYRCAVSWCDLDLTFDFTMASDLEFENLVQAISQNLKV